MATFSPTYGLKTSVSIAGLNQLPNNATPAAWAASTAYAVNDVVAPTTANGYWYVCTTAGTSGSAEPTWGTTVDGTTTDNTVTWTCKLDDGQAISDAVDNSTNLYQDSLIEVTIAGTAATDAFCMVKLLPSEDNSAFATWEGGIPLGTVDLSASPSTTHFSLVNALYQAPEYFKIAIQNRTGAILSDSGNSISLQGINIQSA